MAVFTDKRGRRYQNDKFRLMAVGEEFVNYSKGYYGRVKAVEEKRYAVDWRNYDDNSFYMTGHLSIDNGGSTPVYTLVKKPTIIITEEQDD